jgi:2-C-methyl-D-erythritol 4-phosphate cytidylyltransferase
VPDRQEWSFLVPAAGHGDRLGNRPKAFVEVAGRQLLDYVLETARNVSRDIVVALPPDAIGRTPAGAGVRLIEGGSSRHETVARLAEAAHCEWVIVHDVARPFASTALVEAVMAAAPETGAAAAVAPLDAPVALLNEDRISAYQRAEESGLIQTPLALRKEVLTRAYSAARGPMASTIEVMMNAGVRVLAVTGERRNIKITVAEDLAYAESIARALKADRRAP